eukprot:COSAG02_NODE_358_length_23882_cov_25.508683_9_plen_323_part_00
MTAAPHMNDCGYLPEQVANEATSDHDAPSALDANVDTSGLAAADSPPPARRQREPLPAVVVQESPMRTAIGQFCPVVETVLVGTEIVVNTETQDKRQVPWISITTPGGGTGWLQKSAVRLTETRADTNELDKHFDFRALRHEGELEAWLDLVCEVFADLKIPRSYFARHWSSDPPSLRKLSGVLVAVERRSGRFVATVRIFRRTIRLADGKQVTVGGLGEVSTLDAYRSRGLCSRLLKMSLAEMAKMGLKASSLHAASAASAIYRRLGKWPVAVALVHAYSKMIYGALATIFGAITEPPFHILSRLAPGPDASSNASVVLPQ